MNPPSLLRRSPIRVRPTSARNWSSEERSSSRRQKQRQRRERPHTQWWGPPNHCNSSRSLASSLRVPFCRRLAPQGFGEERERSPVRCSFFCSLRALRSLSVCFSVRDADRQVEGRCCAPLLTPLPVAQRSACNSRFSPRRERHLRKIIQTLFQINRYYFYSTHYSMLAQV